MSTEPIGEIQASYQRMFTRLSAQFPGVPIVGLGCSPNLSYPTGGSNGTDAIDTALQTVLAGISGAVYLDQKTLFGTGGTGPGVGSRPTSAQITANTIDGIHPTTAGYQEQLAYLLTSGVFV